MKKLAIIPAYNEEKNILNTVEDILNNAPEFAYVIINDCSIDNTYEICKKNNLNVVNLPVNLGIGGAVQTGYKYALENGYDVAVQVDGDGQHDASYLEQLVSEMEKTGADMVIGSRFIDKTGFQSSAIRRIGIIYFSHLIKLFTKKTITDSTSGLRLVNRDVIKQFANSYPSDYPEPESIVQLLKQGRKVEEISVIMRERQGGVSSINLPKSIYYMIKVSLAIFITSVSTKRI